MYPYGLIGNCQISALISQTGSLDWLCAPRPDSEPIFGRLLDPEGGHFSIELCSHATPLNSQNYISNTNILTTEMRASDGATVRITDFCPRFEQHGRMYRPIALFRIVEPLEGIPSIQVKCEPIQGWSKKKLNALQGNSHLRFEYAKDYLRLTTNMPLTYLTDSTPFQLKEKLYFALTWSSPVEEDLPQVTERFLVQTRDYWRTWVKHCSIPSLFQTETIRSALALKLHCYEDTGAILAAMTTSLPEEIGGGRNWDYRYCWLRDTYFVLSAFHNLGHFEEMEGFIKFLLDIAHEHESARDRLSPVYSLSRKLPVPEMVHENWSGYFKSSPVRSQNQAAEHIQNDVYGEMILTLAPIFFDERFSHLRVPAHEDLLAHLGFLASKAIATKDAGLWELRNDWKEHTFTNLMCWAGLERIERIRDAGFLDHLRFDPRLERKKAEIAVEAAIKDGAIRTGPQDPSFDAALSLLAILRFPNIEACRETLAQVQKQLTLTDGSKSFFYRYNRKDDFGTPLAAFTVCSFWIAQALSQIGDREAAVSILKTSLAAANPLGLFSEHYQPQTKTQLGNFPQTYSHVGLINAAFSVSPRWSEIL